MSAAPEPAPRSARQGDLAIRKAQPLDAGVVGAILNQASREHAWKPRLHSEAEDIAHAGLLIDNDLVWLAEDNAVRGFLAREGGYVHALYVARGARGRGIGARLIRAAQAVAPRLELYTFVANIVARRIYQRHGFVEIDRSDGARNDENLPDIYFVWDAEVAHG